MKKENTNKIAQKAEANNGRHCSTTKYYFIKMMFRS